MSSLLRVYRLLNLLSLDVAVGAVASAVFFATIAHVSVRLVGMLCLGLVVWIIYTTDHLMDASRVASPASTARHRFHQKYFWALTAAVLVAAVMVALLLIFIRPEVFFWGSILFSLVIIYLVVNQYLHYLKEVVVALMYVLGILLPTLARMSDPLDLIIREEVFCFYLLALLNLLIFSWFDRESDRHEGHPSFAVHFGEPFTKRIIIMLFSVLVVLSCHTAILHPMHGLLIMIMGIILAWIFFWPGYFRMEDRYRLLGDAIFVLPVLILLK